MLGPTKRRFLIIIFLQNIVHWAQANKQENNGSTTCTLQDQHYYYYCKRTTTAADNATIPSGTAMDD